MGKFLFAKWLLQWGVSLIQTFALQEVYIIVEYALHSIYVAT